MYARSYEQGRSQSLMFGGHIHVIDRRPGEGSKKGSTDLGIFLRAPPPPRRPATPLPPPVATGLLMRAHLTP